MADTRQLVNAQFERYGRRPTTLIDQPAAEELFCPIVSADDHVLEPTTLFSDRVPKGLWPDSPQLIMEENGLPVWLIDGERLMVHQNNGAAGIERSDWVYSACGYDQFRPNVSDPILYAQDMDVTGVWASLCFPSTLWGFAGSRFSLMKNADAGLACMRAYNDWMIEEWCGKAPDRFIPCQLTWLADPAIAAQEIYRNAERGFRSVSFSENPEVIGFQNMYSPAWDPFLRACEETETVVNLHIGSSGRVSRPCSDSSELTVVALFPLNGIEALIDWTFAQIPVRFPNIKIVLSEAGASWVPMALERLGRSERQMGSEGKEWPNDAPTPREVALRNFFFTSIEDPSAFSMISLIGDENVMVETDYPHYDSTWPQSQQMIRSELSGFDPEMIKKVCYENACRVYRHPLPPDAMIAASTVGSLAHGTSESTA